MGLWEEDEEEDEEEEEEDRRKEEKGRREIKQPHLEGWGIRPLFWGQKPPEATAKTTRRALKLKLTVGIMGLDMLFVWYMFHFVC